MIFKLAPPLLTNKNAIALAQHLRPLCVNGTQYPIDEILHAVVAELGLDTNPERFNLDHDAEGSRTCTAYNAVDDVVGSIQREGQHIRIWPRHTLDRSYYFDVLDQEFMEKIKRFVSKTKQFFDEMDAEFNLYTED